MVYRNCNFSGIGTSYYIAFVVPKFKLNGILTLVSLAYKMCSNYSVVSYIPNQKFIVVATSRMVENL